VLKILELQPLRDDHLLQLLKLYHASSVVWTLTEIDRCVMTAMPPVIFVENGVILLVAVAPKALQLNLLRLLSLRLFRLCTDLSLLLLRRLYDPPSYLGRGMTRLYRFSLTLAHLKLCMEKVWRL